MITGGASGRANAYFGLGESYRLLGKNGSARTNFQKVLDEYGDSEFAGPAAYALAVLAFSQKDFTAASRSSTKRPQNQRTPRLRYRPNISRRDAWKAANARMTLSRFTSR